MCFVLQNTCHLFPMEDKTRWTQADFALYEAGKKDALFGVLEYASKEKSVRQITQAADEFLYFIKHQPSTFSLPSHSILLHNSYKWTSAELESYLRMIINDLRSRLEKARQVHREQLELIEELKQLSLWGGD